MKSNGLSSTNRVLLKKSNRQKTYASLQEGFLAAKEKQKSLRMQAEKAQFERNQRELQLTKTEHGSDLSTRSEL